MKKFTIFFLMVFMILGNQARCETVISSSSGDANASALSSLNYKAHLGCSYREPAGMLAYNHTGRTGKVYGVNGVRNAQVTIVGPHYACQAAHVVLTADVRDNDVLDTAVYSYTWLARQGGGWEAAIGATNSVQYMFNATDYDAGIVEFCCIVQKYVNGECYGRKDTSAIFMFSKVEPGTVTIRGSHEGCAQSLLTAHTTSPAAVDHWLWYKGNSFVASTSDNTYLATEGGTYTATAVYEGAQYCDDTTASTNAFELTLGSNSNFTASAKVFSDTAASADLQYVCQGGTVALIAQNGTAPYTWYRDGVEIGQTNFTIYSDNPEATGLHTYIVVDALGCSDTTEFHVFAYPTITIGSTGGDHFCANEVTALGSVANVTLMASINSMIELDGYTFAPTYTWVVDGATDIVTHEALFSDRFHPSESPYAITAHLADASRNCVAVSNTIEIMVHEMPTVEIIATPNPVCAGGDVELTAEVTGFIGEAPNYVWTGVEGNTQTVTLEDVMAPTTVSVSVTGSVPYTVCRAINSAEITLIGEVEQPVVQIMNPFDHTPAVLACNDAEVLVEATGLTTTRTDYIYTWYKNGVLIPGADGPSFLDQLNNTTNDLTTVVYSLVLTSTAGCPQKVSADTLNIMPLMELSISGPTQVCEGTEVTLIATAASAQDLFYFEDVANYTWYIDDQDYPNETADFTIPDPLTSQSHPYHIRAIANYEAVPGLVGCSVIQSAEFELQINPQPEIEISPNTIQVCRGGEVVLTTTLRNGNIPNAAYKWQKDGVDIPGINSYLTINPEETADYTVTYYQHYTADPFAPEGSCMATATAHVEVIEDPVIEAVKIEPTADSICTGSQVTVTALVQNPVGDEIFTWYRNGELIEGVTGSTFTETVTADGYSTAYTYMAVVSRPASGCESNAVSSRTIQVVPMPSVQITGDHNVCELVAPEANVLLTARVNDEHGINYTYEWRRDNVTVGDNANVFKQNIVAGEYDYTVVVTDPNTGCFVYSDPFHVTVSPALNASIIAPTAFCNGAELPIEVSLANAIDLSNINYTWSTGETTAAITTAAINAQTTITVTVTDVVSGCSVSESVNLTPKADPVLTLTLTPDAICYGAEVTPSVVVNAGTGVEGAAYTYTWTRNGQIIEGVTGSSFTEVPTNIDNEANSFTYEVYATQSAYGCESAPVRATVTVNPNPTVAISGDAILCAVGDQNTVNLTANLSDTIPGQTYVYTWRIDNVPQPQTGNTFSKQLPARDYPYVFTVEVAGSNGCSVMSEPYNVYINREITVNVTATSTSVCPGVEVTLTANVGNNFSDLNYRWYTVSAADGEILLPGENGRTLTINPTATTTYRVRILQGESFCEASGDLRINVITTPLTMHLVPSNELSICEGGEVDITAVVDIENPQGTYTWYRNNQPLNMSSTATRLMDSPVAIDGDSTRYIYSVVFTQDSTGCTTSAERVVDVYPNISVVLSGDQIICEGNRVSLIANIQGYNNNVAPVQTWYLNNQIIENPTLDSYNNYTNIEFTDVVARSARDEAYIYSVEIDRGNGCVTRSADFPVQVMSKPVVTISADDTTICANGNITFTANLNNYNTSDIVYQWYLGGELISGATSSTYTPSLAEGDNQIVVDVTQTTSRCYNSDTMDVVVRPIPTVSIEINRDSICDGFEITVEATPASGVTNEDYTYTWYRNGEIIEGATNNIIYDAPEAVGTAATMYVYGVAVSQGSSACASTIVYDTVFVRPNPSIEISGDAIYCNNGAITLSAQVNDYDEVMGELTYQWRLNNADIAGQQTTTLNDSREAADEPYIYTIVATNATTGCSVTSEPYYVYVNSDVIVEVTATDTIICAGGEVTLTANLGDYNAENITYRWLDPNSNPINGATSGTLTIRPTTPGINQYKVNVLQTTSECAASGSINIEVIAAPQLALTLNQSMVCSGGEVALRAIANQEGTFAWYKNNVRINGADQDELHDSPIAIDRDSTYYVYGVIFTSDIEGCQASHDTVVIAYPNPFIVITGDPIICDGTNVQLTANVQDYDTTLVNLRYQWLLGNTRIGTNANTLTYTVPDSTDAYQFSVVVYDNAGCRSVSEPYPVYVNNNIVVDITADDTTICNNGTVTLTANLADYNDDYLIYQWFANDEPIVGATSRTLTTTVPSTTTYKVRVEQTTSACEAFGQIKINVADAPAIASINLSETSVCTGYQIRVTATIDPAHPGVADDAYTFTWYRNGELIEGVTGSIFYDAPHLTGVEPQTFIYSAIVSQPSSACTSAEFTSAQTLTVHPMPTVVVSGDQQICYGDNVELYAHIQLDDATDFSTTTYEWLVDNNITGIPGNLDGGQTIYYFDNIIRDAMDEPYMFSVRIDRGPGCIVTSEPLPVYIYDAPDVNITAEETEICTNGSTVLRAHINNYNIEDLTFQWYEGATTRSHAIAGANEPIYTTANIDETKHYFVIVTQTTTLCADTAEIIVNVNEVPEISSITLSEENICRGAQITVTATAQGGVPGDAYTYTWYRNGVLLEGITAASFTDDPTIADVDANEFVYTATVSQPSAGCISAIATSNTLSVFQNPTVEISGDAILCNNTEVNLTAHINDDNVSTGALTYQWRLYNQNIDGATTDNLVQTVAAQDEPYMYTVQISNENGCTTISEPYAVYVNDDVTVEVTATDTIICAGGVVTLIANLGDYNSANLVYRWYTLNNGIENMIHGATSRTLEVNPIETTDYVVRVMQTTSECQASGSIQVKVIEAPEVTLTLAPDSVICSGGEITLTATVEGEGTYAWYRNQQLIAGADQDTYTDSPLAVDNDVTTYEYAVIFTPDIEGCVSATVDTVVTVYPNHTVEITGDPIICLTNEVSLTANINDIVEGSTYTYQWMLANANIPSATDRTYTDTYSSSDNAYIFTVRATNELSGCSSVSEPFYVYVNANPVVSVTADEMYVCADGQTTLTAHLGDYNQPNLTYQWYKDNVDAANAINGATEATLTTNMTETTTYHVVVSQPTSSCSASGQITITHYDIPTVTLAVGDVTDSTICDGGQVTLVATPVVNANMGAYTFNWYDNGQLIEGVTGDTYTVSPGTVDGDITVHHYTVVVAAEAPACISEASNEVTINVVANPVILLTADQTVCEYELIEITANIIGTVNTPLSHQWYSDNTAIYPAGLNDYEDVPGRIYNLRDSRPAQDEPYYYTFELIMGNGCRSISEPIAIHVNKAPIVTVILNDTNVCVGGQVTAEARLDNYNLTDLTYQWKLNGRTVPGETMSTYTTSALNSIGDQTISVVVFQTTSECEATASKKVHVVNDPVIASVQVSADRICAGYEVTVTATPNTATGIDGEELTYTWYRNGVMLEGITAPTFSETPIANEGDTAIYIYTAVVSQPSSGCISEPVSDTLYVFPNPTVNISGDQIICQNDTIYLTANVNDYNLTSTDLTYEWRLFNETVTSDVANVPAGQFRHYYENNDQPYIFTVEVSNEFGCSAISDEYPVYINDSVHVEVTCSEDSICPGVEVTFTANLADYNADFLTYRWSRITQNGSRLDTTAIWGATGSTLTYRPDANTYRFKVDIAQTNSGCIAVGYDSVKVISAPEIEFTNVSDTAICFGGEVTMTVTPLSDGYYTWYRNGQLIPGANLNNYYDSPASIDGDSTTYHYAVIYTPNVAGCRSAMIDTLVHVYANPSIQITGDNLVCTNTENNVRLIAHLSDTISETLADGDITYTWFESNNVITNNLSQNDTLLLDRVQFRDDPYLYTVQITNNRGCSATSPAYPVYVNQNINVEVTSDVDSVCAGGAVELVANLFDYNSSNLIYRWFAKGESETQFSPVFGGTSRTLTYAPEEKTYFYVHIDQTTSHCQATGRDTISVISAPNLKLVSDRVSDSLCDGGQVVFTVTDENDHALQGGVYTWFRNGVVIDGAISNTLVESPLAVDGDPTMYYYSVTYAPDVVGCYADTVSDTLYVFGNPTVVISGDPLICNTEAGNNLSLYANVNDNYENLDYQWRLFNSDLTDNAIYQGTATNTLNGHLNASENPYIFTVEVSNEYGCITLSEEFPVYVNDAGAINVAVTSDHDSVCRGAEVTLTAHLADYNSTDLTYQWWYYDEDHNRVDIPWGTESTLTYEMEQTTDFYVDIYQTTSGCRAQGHKRIFVFPDVPYIISSIVALNTQNGTTLICDGGEVEVSIELEDYLGNTVDPDRFTYIWYRNGTEMPLNYGPWFRESPLTVDQDTTHYTYSAVIVMDIPGCEHSAMASSNTITVTRNPIVAISGSPYVCEYTPVSLNAWVDGYFQDYHTTYHWYLDGQSRDTEAHRYTYTELLGVSTGFAYNVTVEAVNANGCSNISDPFQVVVVEAPVTTIVRTEDTICQGGEVTLTATLENYNLEYLQYQWYRNEYVDTCKIPGATQPTYTTTLDSTTKFIVAVFSALVGDDMLCTSIDSTTIVVVSDPVVESVTISEDQVCDGGQVTVTAHTTMGVPGDAYTFTWYRNGILMEGITDSTFTESPLTIDNNITRYVYSAVATQVSSGCMSAQTFASDTLVVYPNPTVVIAGDPIICEDSVIMLEANVTNDYSGAELTYTWLLYNDTIRPAAVGADTIIDARGPQDYPYIYTVVVNNANGCLTESAPYYVYVNDTIVVEVTSTEDTICESGSITLTANLGDYNDSDLTYRWYASEISETNEIFGATQAQLTIVPDSTMTYYVRVFQNTSACETYGSYTITVNERPVIDSIILSDYAICDGGQVTITAYTHGGVDTDNVPYIYTWYLNNELVEGETGATFTVSPTTVDGDVTELVYSAVVSQSISGCTSDSAMARPLSVHPNPSVVIESDPVICENDSVQLRARVTNEYEGANLQYTWELENVVVATGSATFDTVLDPRDHAYNFTVVVSNELGCVTESASYAVTVNPRPVVEVTADQLTICEGGVSVLTANIDNYNLNNLMYQWYETSTSNPLYGDMQRVVTVAPDDTTDYIVEVYQVGSECYSYDTITINVNEIPVIDAVTLSFYEMCYGGQPTITASVHGGVDVNEHPYYFTWYRNGVEIPGVHGASFTDEIHEPAVDNDDTYYIYTAVVRQDVSGCVSEPVSADRLNVYMNPRVQITGDPYVCETGPVFVYANVDTTSINVGELHYTWYESGQLRDNTAYGYGDSFIFSEYFYERPNAYLMQVEVTRDHGCRTMSDPFEVYVMERPVVHVTATETDICVGGEVTMAANIENYHHEDLTFQWYENSVDRLHEIYGATQPFYTASNIDETTTYYVRVYRYLSECVDIDGVTVNVHADPTVTLSVSDEDTVICGGGEITLNASADYDAVLGAPTYTWTRNHVVLDNTLNSTFVDHPLTVDNDSVNYNYGVYVTLTASGCQSTVTDSSSINVNVLRNATVEIQGDPVICGAGTELDTIHLVANVNDTSAFVDGFNYEWRLFNRTIGADDNIIGRADSNVLDILLAPSTEPYVFTAHVWNENGCSTESARFPVYVTDTTSVVVTASETDICVGGEVTLYANLGDYHVSNLTYQWFSETNGVIDTIAGATSAEYTTTLQETTTFFVNLVQTTSSCLSYSEITINVHEDPTVALAISDEDTVICEGGQFTLTATAHYDSILGAATYTWYRNGIEIEGVEGNVLTESPVTVDGDITNYTYEVVVSLEASGCQSVVTDSSTINVEVHPNLTVVIAGDPVICGAGVAADHVILTAQVNDTSAYADGYEYEWRLFNNTLPAFTTDTLDMALSVSENPYIFNVVINNENGCTAMSEPFYVYVNDTAEVVVTSSENDICVGGQVTVAANIGDYNMPNLTYQWYKVVEGDTTLVAGATQAEYTTTLMTTTTFYVEIEQSTSSCLAYGSVDVNVHADPTVSLAISDEDTVICEGGEFTLTATAYYDAVLGEPTYTWFKNGVEIANAHTATLHESQVTVDNDVTTNTYSVMVTLTASGCQSIVTDSSSIVVTVLRNASVVIAGDPVICGSGDNATSVQLTANVNDTSALVDGFNYEWRLFNNTISTGVNSIDTTLAPSVDPYIFTVVVSNENGCTVYSEPYNVMVNEAVAVEITATETDICEGGVTTLTANLNDYNTDALTYQWQLNGADIYGATQSTYTTPNTLTVGSYDYTVVVRQTTSDCVSADTYTVNVHADPVVTVAISDEDTVICEGGEFTLTASATYDPELGDVTYTWTKNGVVIEGANSATLHESQVTVDNDVTTYTYAVVATLSASGCQSLVTDASTIAVTVLRNASVVIAGDPVICGSGANATSVQLTANVNDTSALVDGFDYEWRLFNTTIATGVSSIDTTLAPSVDPYIFTLVISNENGCSTASAPFNVMVNAAPEVVVTATESDICEGGATILTANLGDYNTESLTYQWQLNGIDIPGATASTYTTPVSLLNGQYDYSVIVYQTTSDCIATANYVVNVHAEPIITGITVSNATICDGGQVVVTATGNYDSELGNAIYTWYRNGIELEGVTGNTFTDYPVIVDDQTTFTYSAVVTLAASGCTSAEVSAPVVTVNTHATIMVVADASTTICEGGNVTLTANVDPAGTYTYQWYLDNEPVGHNSNVYVAQGLNARETAYMVHVVATGDAGCITSTINDATAITVVADPVITLADANNGGEATVCVGGTATLTASYVGGVDQINGLGTPTYTWFNNGEQVGEGNTYVIPDTLAAGSYAYTVVASFANSNYGCDVNTAAQGTTGVYNFTVVDDPTPFIAVNVDNDSVVCVGGQTALYVHHIDGGIENGNYEYQWYRNGIILAGETNPTLTTDANLLANNYEYQVEVRLNGVACNGWSNTITIPVVATPVATIEGAANVCFGGQVTMTAAVDNTYGANVTYQWNRNGQAIAGATESTYTTDAHLTVGEYNYSVTVISTISNCATTSGIVAANVVADPTVAILGAADVCQGGTVEMTAVVSETYEGATYDYTWYRNNEVVGSNSATYTTDASLTQGNYIYSVEITPVDMNGCNAISASVNANVIGLPTATITGNNIVCEGGSTTLTANVYPVLNGNSYNYAWYRDGIALNANTAAVTTSADLTPGTYTYTVEVWNASYDVACRAMAQFDYTVVADPTIDSIVTSLDNNQMCIGGTVTLTANMSSDFNVPNNALTYHWMANGRTMNSTSSNTVTVTPDHTGINTYSVYVTVNNSSYTNTGCQSEVATVDIEVVEQPYVAISHDGLLQVCEGGYVELNAVLEGGVGMPTITWRRNNGRISAFDNLTTIHTDTNDRMGTYTYSVTATYPYATGCAATSNDVTVSVLYQPVWGQTVVAASDLCQDETIYLTATISGGIEDANHQTGSYIQWVYAPANDPTDVTNVIGGLGGQSYDIVTDAGIFNYYPTYIAPANTNCVPSNAPNATMVTVHEHPTAIMNAGEGSDVLCWNDVDDNATINFTFTGTAPFHFFLQNMTTNEIEEYTSYTNFFTLEVTPDVTTTYQIFQLSDRYCEGEVVNAGTVTVTVSHFAITVDSVALCPEYDDYAPVTFEFNNLTVNDDRDSVWFQIVDYNNIGFTYEYGLVDLTNNTVTVYMPTVEPGIYHFGIVIDGCEYDVTVNMLWGSVAGINIMDQKWDDVAVCNNNPATNGGHTFVAFQWYRNGELIPGATNQYYQEVGGLNGFYSLWVMDDQGNEYWTCEMNISSIPTLRVYPVPAKVGVEITIELPMSAEELDGAVLDIFDAKGALVQSVTNLQQITRISGFEAQGTYFGRVTTATNSIETVKFIIVK